LRHQDQLADAEATYRQGLKLKPDHLEELLNRRRQADRNVAASQVIC
jgi:hypothetical protein